MSSKTSELKDQQCIPCKGDVPPMKSADIKEMTHKISIGWACINEHHLEKTYSFKNFREALQFTNEVGELAEEQGHHPDIYLTYGEVKISIHTHKIHGLTPSDFILAAKIDTLSN